MKIILIAAFSVLSVSQKKCTRSPVRLQSATCFKGRLEIKGSCSNYTIKLLQGKMDTTNLAAVWRDETTGKPYTNVFALGSPCTFPSNLNAGDEFFFTLDSSSVQECATCMAYYPHPQKAVKIKVITGPCK